MTVMPVEHEHEGAERALVTLLSAATAAEHPKIISAAVRAGLMWHCKPCRSVNYPTRESCDECREPRPTGQGGQ
jgi:hypothetical protein